MSEAGGYKNIGTLAADTGGAIAIGPFGSAMKAEIYSSSGVRVIRGTNFGDTGTWKGDWVFVPDAFVDKMPRCEVRAGDLVFPHRGSIGEVAIVPDDGNRYCLSTSLMKATLDPNKADPLFVCYYLKSPTGRQEIMRFSSQVGTPGIGQPLASLRQFNVPNPDVETQRAVVSVLSALDDKIELNRRMNETLEGMAQAIFRDWFVDFGPTRRKAAGEADPVAIMGGLTPNPAHAAHLASLFPASLGNDGLPVGWASVPVSKLIAIVGGGTPKTSNSSFWNGPIPWFSVTDTPAGKDLFVFDTEKSITHAGLESSSARLVPAGTTIISARGTVGNLALAAQEMTFNQSCYALRSSEGDRPFFTFLAAANLVEVLKGMAHGSVFSTITRKTFDCVQFADAGGATMDAFDATVSPLFARIRAAVDENRTLAETRDYLLPRLMSGAVRVSPQAEAA